MSEVQSEAAPEAPPYRRHAITINGAMTSVRSCETGRECEDVGGCSDGCCDDYRCPDCGKKFRVEWPD